MTDSELLDAFELHLTTAQLSPVTIHDRLEIVRRLAKWLAPMTLLTATSRDLERFQQSFVHLSRASMDIYTRHIRAFYRWAVDYGQIDNDPTGRMVTVKTRRGIPHPISEGDLRMLLACSLGGLRMAYVLAAFAGLRAGEVARLRGEDLQLDAAQPVALIHGKGGRERIVPLLPPVVAELRRAGFPRTGPVAVQQDGRPFTPEQLSFQSTVFMQRVGVKSTLHSCRHYFATEVVKLTKDILLVRDLLGHESVATTQIYMASSIDGAQDRLAAFSSSANGLIGNS